MPEWRLATDNLENVRQPAKPSTHSLNCDRTSLIQFGENPRNGGHSITQTISWKVCGRQGWRSLKKRERRRTTQARCDHVYRYGGLQRAQPTGRKTGSGFIGGTPPVGSRNLSPLPRLRD